MLIFFSVKYFSLNCMLIFMLRNVLYHKKSTSQSSKGKKYNSIFESKLNTNFNARQLNRSNELKMTMVRSCYRLVSYLVLKELISTRSEKAFISFLTQLNHLVIHNEFTQHNNQCLITTFH
jgi:hypothetical protein